MKLKTKISTGIILVFMLIIVPSFFYTDEPDQIATVKRLGFIEKAIIKAETADAAVESMKGNNTLKNVKLISRRGLFFKIPFLDQVTKYDAKYLTYISLPETINTSDRRKLDIEMYA
jgi:membrane protease subunit HflC